MEDFKTSYQLPQLPFKYDALEPIISKEIIEIHYDKHHRAYVNKLNQALEKYHEAERDKDTNKMIKLQSDVRFNAGGHINHSIYWSILTPNSEKKPKGELESAIIHDFGSFEEFKEELTNLTIAIQGSGWGWLGFNKFTKHLEIMTTFNQDLLSMHNLSPLFCIDVWEHAYYLQYKNKRDEYVKNIWNILNWQEIEKKFFEILQK